MLLWLVILTPFLGNDPADSLVAQGIEPISGGSGWVGAGLLGAVLCWLLVVYLPAKDKQMTDFQNGKDKLLLDVMTARDGKCKEEATVREQRHKEDLLAKDTLILQLISAKDKQMQDMLLHCEGEMVKVTTNLRAEFSHMIEAIEDLSEHVRIKTP